MTSSRAEQTRRGGRPVRQRQRPRPTVSDPTVRVAHVIGWLDRGGAETVSLDICRAIPPDDVQQTFITLNGREGTLADDFRAAGAEVAQCPVIPLRTFGPRLWRCLRLIRPDVVVSHVSLTSAVILLVARLAGVPVRIARFWSEGDGRADTRYRRVRRALLRRLLRRVATDVVGVTTAALALAGPPTGDDRYRVLYNSVDPARVRGWERAAARARWRLPTDVPVLAYLGRSAPEKNRPFLIEVHRAVRARWPDARLFVVGPGGPGDLIRAYPEIVDDPLVVLAGETDEIASVLAATDVLLLPSRREGLPGVVLEALAAGVPVVATDLPCLREVEPRVRGLALLPLADGPYRWADATVAQIQLGPVAREEIRRSLHSSPFLLANAVTQWRTLWTVGRR
ncbi:glycosyltransferase family 4 protein [Micromonospora sp. NBC_01796]|uniref:glycosyltransferase family 4 protein n=1 Tax=Micromonospora sp. NBC_01796 TaxID=2975987 RepID=UPI002DD90090|nr:glycosyltransferase family 4 protein [Micromonospora sp. NBC_01796]WSA86385.1 glycosyltransferase family 4 protein [Micromonospora sp. NBC_01796]